MDDNLESESSQNQLKSFVFQTLKQNSHQRKKSIDNLIKAYQFRYSQLWNKTIKGLKSMNNYQYKLLQWKRLKNAIRVSQKDVLHSIYLIRTQRLRKYMNVMIDKIKQKKIDKHKKKIGSDYKEFYFKERMFKYLKLGTLLYRLTQKHINRQIITNKKIFIKKLIKLRHLRRQREEKQIEYKSKYDHKSLARYFSKWKSYKQILKQEILESKLKFKYQKQFLKCLKLINKQSNKQADKVFEFYINKLLRKSLNGLINNSIQLKIKKYYNFKRTEKLFFGWKKLVARVKEEQANIPKQIIYKLLQLNQFSLKKFWFNKMHRQYQKRNTNKQKSQAIKGYYNLKTEEIIYKKYFYAFVQNKNISKAQRHYIHILIQKSFQSLKLALINKRRAIRLSKKADQFYKKRLLAKSLTILMIPVQKSRTAIEWKKLYNKKLYLQKWIQSIVQTYVQNSQKADKFYRFNMYFKVLLGFKLNVDFNAKTMDVIKMRIARRIKAWRKQHRLKQFKKDRDTIMLAVVFRSWKFYIRY